MSEERNETDFAAPSKGERDRGLPNRLRRQPRGSGRSFSYPVTTALDVETFEAVDAASQQRGVTRSLIVQKVLREWAMRGAQLPSA
jgi:hypothetical protein